MKFSELAATIQQHQFEDAKVCIFNSHTEQFEEVTWVILGTNDHVIQLQSQLMTKTVDENVNP